MLTSFNLGKNRNKRLAAVLLPALCSLLFFSCDDSHGIFNYNSRDYKSFDYDLQGTWETNSTSEYSGTLVISYNTITISGYTPNQGYEWTNGTERRPFKDFTKNAPLEGYSEDGKIFIKDAGVIQEGIPYTPYSGAYSSYDSKQPQFLRFNFGGRQETLRKQ